MTAHIHHKSQKPMATGSAWGRLLTIAFLCLFLVGFATVQNAFAIDVDLNIIFNNGGLSTNSIQVKSFPLMADIGFPCSDTCTVKVPDSTDILLVATVGPEWTFFDWSGNISGAINPSPVHTMPLIPQSVTATFVPKQYPVDADVMGGSGTATPATATVDHGSSHTVTIAPTAGWYISAVTDNGVPVAIGDATGFDYTINPVTEAHTVEVTFSIYQYPVDADVMGGSGTATPATATVDHGSSHTVTIAPTAGWYISAVTDNGVPVAIGDATGFDYTINPVTEAHTVEVTFSIYQYPVDADVMGGSGTATPATATVDHGSSHTVTIAPTAGWYISAVTDNGVPVAIGDATGFDYTINPVTEAHTVEVTFSIYQYPVDADVMGGSGTATPATATVDHGSSHTVTIAPTAGWYISAVTDNGVPVAIGDATGFDYTINPVTEAHTVEVTFSIYQYPVDADVMGGSGTATPATATVDHGSSHTVTIAPTAGWYISAVTDNGVPVAIGDATGFDYTINPVTEAHTVEVTFSIYQYPVDADVMGGSGTATPATATVDHGSSHTVTIAPTAGWYISAVTDNGVPVAIGDATGFDYTINPVTEAHTVEVTFSIYQYPVDADVMGGSGTATPATATVDHGSSHTVTIAPTAGWYISAVTDNGVPVAIGDATGFDYTINPVTEAHTVEVTFSIYQYPVDADVMGGSGTATPATATVDHGSSHTVTIAPTAGWYISAVTDNGVPVAIGDATGFDYTINPVTEAHTVEVTFSIYQYPVDADVMGGSGTATPATATVDHGSSHTVTIAPTAGWYISAVTDNGVPVAIGDATGFDYTINPVTEAHTVEVTFSKTNYMLTWTVTGNGSVSPPSGTTYVYDEALTITATPAPGWEFVNWTGDTGNLLDSTSASTALKNPLTANTDLTANFILIDYTLTVTSAGGTGGTTDRVTVSASGPYHYGDVVTLTANPQAGETFAGWSANVVSTGSTTGEVIMNSNQVVTATFDFIEYTLTVTSAGGTGGATDRVAVSPPGTYHYGDVVALTANPQVGETFANWSGDLAGSTNPETITINADKTVTANFEKIPVTLTMQVDILDGGAFGTVTPDPAGNPYTYLWGDTVAVSAIPNPNSAFAGWSPNVVGGVVTMNGDQTVIATFELKKFSVTFNAGAHGLVQEGANPPTNSITQQVKWGQSSTLVSAVPDAHYHILNWTNDIGDIVSTVEGLQVAGVTEDLEFTANFEIDKFSVTFISSNYGGIEVAGTPPEYFEDEYTEIVDWGSNSKWVTARLDDFSQFQGWHGDYTSADVTIQVTNVQQDMTITYDTVPDINGCSTDVAAGYSGGFQATDFKRVNVDVDSVTGHMVLNTGNQAIDPNNIVIPFTQDVYVTFLYEGAGFQQSDFGYKFASEGKAGTKHQIYANINDNDNDGVLDGVGDRNLDGTIDRQDNKVFLGTIEGGTELVFYLDSTDNGCGGWCGDIFYTKRDWNDHDAHARCAATTTGIGRLVKLYENATEGDTTCYGYVAACGTGVHEQGWLNAVARTRLNSDFGFNFRAPEVGDPAGFNTKCIDELNATASTHAIVGAPDETPFAWVIGFDDTTMDNASKSNDYDYNDVVFLVERKTGGMAQLELANAIVPNEANAYFTAVTFDVWDFHPAGDCTGKTHTTYYVSAEGGAAGSWIEITEWDKINVSDSSKTIGAEIDPATWTPGTPEYTYRSRRIDLAGLGRTGNQLLWKAELVSEDEDCAPRIVDVQLKADTASHGFFARSSPVVQTNVIYAGTYETPSAAFPADERLNRGHLTANLLYVPEDPSQTLVDNTATADIDETLAWDAGEVLKNRSPDTRVIKFPDVTVTAEPDAILTDGAGDPIQGDGVTRTFSGTFPHYPVVATTVRIHDSDNDESFTDEFTDDLKGSLTGTGTINRFTGEWTVTFTNAPGAGKQIMASYSHYTASSLLKEFNNANVTTDILALNNQMVNTRYIHDFNGDNNFGESDADWLVQWVRGYKQPNTSTQKAWKLGPIDHSTPALLVPPGFPLWYFGSQVTKAERNEYKNFKDALEDRNSVLFVGSRDGMLHAFDAGKYRYGDNPETAGIEENRGYFLWEPKPSPAPDYCTNYAGNCPNYGTGEELWAFIPANLLPRLKNNLLKADDQSFVDASPALSDVYIDTNGDGDSDSWRTVLLSAEGNGGDTVFCLDVTDPLNPTFMWEFAAPELFRSRSSPAVAQIGRIRDPNGTDAVKWVAFFVTGKVENSTLFPSIYMIDIADGSVLRRVVLDDPFDLDGDGFIKQPELSDEDGDGTPEPFDVNGDGTIDGPEEVDYGRGGVPSGQPAIVDSDENGYIDRLYVATDKGLMYKVNIPDDPKNPAPWDISHCVLNIDFTDDDNNTIASDQHLHPIYASPAIVVDNSITTGGDIQYKVMVFFGTGDNPYYDENINTATTRYHFFAYVDTNEKGESDPAKHNLDWFIELPAGNRIFASAFAAAGQIYFGTSTAETEDPCEGHLTPEGNEGRIYVVTLEGVVLLNKVVGDIRTSPLVEDEHLYFRTPTGLQSLGSGIYNNEVQAAGEPTINIRAWREIIN